MDRLHPYGAVRAATEALCSGLPAEDLVVQSMPDASPLKWHLAHTSWFFENFVLAADARYRPFHPRFNFLFNSYYEAVGERWQRAERGVLSRPTVDEVRAYRRHVDGHVRELLPRVDETMAGVIELGLNHEEQHQELILTDVKHMLSLNPLEPVYRETARDTPRATALETGEPPPLSFIGFDEGIRECGFDGDGFAFDNERPRHRQLVPAFAIASRLTSAGEFLDFIADGGYTRPELWLSDGWAAVQQQQWRAPLYWRRGDGNGDSDGDWHCFTLGGWRRVARGEPVCHVSYYEADAFARWAGARLPTEFEWETASARASLDGGSFVESGRFHPALARGDGLQQMFGEAWQWTASAYSAYPGYRALPGALGEYNGKFMCNQLVLRGGSCATPRRHLRATYRNFFPAGARWQFSALRLARDAT